MATAATVRHAVESAQGCGYGSVEDGERGRSKRNGRARNAGEEEGSEGTGREAAGKLTRGGWGFGQAFGVELRVSCEEYGSQLGTSGGEVMGGVE